MYGRRMFEHFSVIGFDEFERKLTTRPFPSCCFPSSASEQNRRLHDFAQHGHAPSDIQLPNVVLVMLHKQECLQQKIRFRAHGPWTQLSAFGNL